MANQFGIPEEELAKIRARDRNCVYCHKRMIYPLLPASKETVQLLNILILMGHFI